MLDVGLGQIVRDGLNGRGDVGSGRLRRGSSRLGRGSSRFRLSLGGFGLRLSRFQLRLQLGDDLAEVDLGGLQVTTGLRFRF